MDIHIHSVETGYQCRDHQCNGKAGHAFHDGIHVVGDDRGKGVHRSGEDIAVDIHGIKCLFQLDNHVFYQFLVQKVSVLKDTLQLSDHYFISSDGGVEVNECFLQSHQTEQVFVADTAFQFFFGGADIQIYLFQIFQKPYGRRINQPENQIEFVADFDSLSAGVFDEVRQQVCVVVAD